MKWPFVFSLALLWCAALPAANITLVGKLDPFPGENRYGDVWGEGNLAFIGSFDGSGVGIVDLSSPASPKLLAHYQPDSGGLFEDMQVKNGIGYFASWDGGGLHIVSVTNPAAPVLLKQVTAQERGFDTIHNVFVDGNYVYLADSATPTVKVFDVSTPSDPVFVRDIRTTDTVLIHDMTVISNRLYTSGWGGKTDIFDVTDVGSQAPKRMGTVNTGAASHSSWVSADGKILASCAEYEAKDLRLYNISDPAKPMLLSRITSKSIGVDAVCPHNPVIVGNLLFVSWYQAGLQVLNISNPTNPIVVGSFDTFPGGQKTPGGLDSGPDRYDGNWGVYPLLGLDRVLLSDLDGGLFVVDATKVAGADSDGDRLPDNWEMQNNLNPQDASDARADADGDHASNLNEFLSSTNPQDTASALIITAVERSGTNLEITFSSVGGSLYSVEKNSRWATAGWTILRDEIEGNGGVVTVTHTNVSTLSGQFYRVAVRP